ncbi:MAG: hypothetical protein JXR40_13160 [Pontiellaceae bacterium]|nr:hypothetical protein [Pontiellaceae bacterium]
MKISKALIPFMALLTSCGKQSAEPMSPAQFEELISDSTDYLKEKIAWCEKEYKIGTYPRYDWNQETGELIWSDNGVPKVIAKVQFVGSISKKSNTWLWSWANETILDKVKSDILTVKRFGEENQIPKLTNAKWPAEEVDGWEMTSVAAKLCNAKGAYRTPGDNGFTFMIITDISWEDKKESSAWTLRGKPHNLSCQTFISRAGHT